MPISERYILDLLIIGGYFEGDLNQEALIFARVKKSGNYQYLQIVENKRQGKKVSQRVIATVGRLDKLQEKGQVETLVRSLARFSEKALMILSGKSDPSVNTTKIGPALIFERLWNELKLKEVIQAHISNRKFGFKVERAIFLTVLHRFFTSGSDRSCEKWKRDHAIHGTEELSLRQLYRAMSFLGEVITDQDGATPFAPRCMKDIIEEDLYFARLKIRIETYRISSEPACVK